MFRLDFRKLTKQRKKLRVTFFYSFGVFGGKSLQFAGSLTCERQWTMAQTRHKDPGDVQFSSESIKLLLKIEVHYVLFWTTRQVFPERREL